MNQLRLLSRFLIPSILCSVAPAQTVLLREGDPAPPLLGGTTIGQFGNLTTNDQGGFACVVTSAQPFSGAPWYIWGSFDDAPPGTLRTTQTIGGVSQARFGDGLSLSDDQIAYGAVALGVGGTTELESVWLDDTLVALEGAPAQNPNREIATARFPNVTNDGRVIWQSLTWRPQPPLPPVGGRTAIYEDSLTNAIIRENVSYPGLPDPVRLISNAIRVSASGAHSIMRVILDSPFPERALLVDQQGFAVGSGTAISGELVDPVAGGLPGEFWLEFRDGDVNDQGDVLFAATTSAVGASASVLVKNGQLVYRGGDIVDDVQLGGFVGRMALGPRGDVAFLWSLSSGGNQEFGLFLDGRFLARPGDAVDLDGDGVIDPGTRIVSFLQSTTGVFVNDQLAVDARGDVLVVAQVEAGQETRATLLRYTRPELGSTHCVSTRNSTGMRGVLEALGSEVVADNALQLVASRLPSAQFGIFITSPSSDLLPGVGGTSNGNLCLGTPLGRFVGPGQVQNSGAAGTFSLSLDLGSLPIGGSGVAGMPGESWFFQAWHRDTSGFGSNLTDGLRVLLR